MKKKFRIADIFVVILCLSGTFFSGYRFWRDLHRTLTKNSETPVGIISYKRNGAQRRFEERLAWGSVWKDSPVYNGDLIRTADLSDAVITFNNAAEVRVSENSLIQVFYDPGLGARLELSGGAVAVAAGEKDLVISSGGKELTLSAGGLASVNAGEEFAVTVMAGSASLHADGESRELDAGAALSVAASGRIEDKPQVTVLAPLPGQKILSRGPAPVVFSFQTSNFLEGERVRLDLAFDRRFSRIIETIDSPSNSGMTVELAPGVYWWRAYPRGGNAGDSAAPGMLSIVGVSAPLPQYPGDGAFFAYEDGPPEIRFLWKTGDSGSQEDEAVYILEAADNPAMRNVFLSEKVDGYSYTAENLGEGTWYWRVTPRYPDDYRGTASGSGVSAFTIGRVAALAPAEAVPAEPPAVETASADPVVAEPSAAEPAPAERAAATERPSGERVAAGKAVPVAQAPEQRTARAQAARPAAPLEKPQAVQPPHNARIDTAYIRQNLSPASSGVRSFTFTWEAAPGANAYSFALYRAGPDGSAAGAVPLIGVSPLYGTSCRLENLDILEDGEYIWQLTALSVSSGGAVERKGETAEYRFSLSIPRPGAPVLTVPETLYGF